MAFADSRAVDEKKFGADHAFGVPVAVSCEQLGQAIRGMLAATSTGWINGHGPYVGERYPQHEEVVMKARKFVLVAVVCAFSVVAFSGCQSVRRQQLVSMMCSGDVSGQITCRKTCRPSDRPASRTFLFG